MIEDQKHKILQSQLDESRDWFKFVLGEYFKWYAAFLTLNILAFGFLDKVGQLIAATFASIDVVGAMLAFAVLYWVRTARRSADAQRAQLLALAHLTPEDGSYYPRLPVNFGLLAAGTTQFIFAAVWVGLLRPELP